LHIAEGKIRAWAPPVRVSILFHLFCVFALEHGGSI
jgi:hypothetical protein